MPAPMEKVFSLAVGGSMHKIIPFSNSPQYLTSVLPSSRHHLDGQRAVALRRRSWRSGPTNSTECGWSSRKP